jgi:putative ABC transport system ATP-binding protein
MPLIELKNVEKTYRLGETTVRALRSVDLNIDAGEFAAVWGPSGSGKTTLLNLIGAIDEPSKGEVFINGKNIKKMSDNKRSELRNRTIGFVFQGFNLVPVLTALENVMLPLQISGTGSAKAKETAMTRLADVGLKDFMRHRPDKLSGGQQQRVSIARALAVNPAVVIADEPTANLDSKTARTIIGIMRELNKKEGVTFIFATHDQRLLDQVKRIVRMKDGQIED